MSSNVFKTAGNELSITSYCGPADTGEPTRMRLQFDIGASFTSIGMHDAVALRAALDQWIEAAGKRGIPYTISEVETVLRTHTMDPYHRELMQWLVGKAKP